MPIYEYLCGKCGSHFEKRQSASDEPLRICEKCGGDLKKQWSLSGFQFKGGGWYVTDYSAQKGGSDGKSSGSESTSSPDSASKPSSEPSTSKASDSDGKKD